jgi:hypothetical protein
MNLMGFFFILLTSFSGQAMQCVDLFPSKTIVINNEQTLETLPENFEQMDIYQRQETLDYMAVRLKSELKQNPKPNFFDRFLTRDGIARNREHARLSEIYAKVKKLKDAYHVVYSLLHGEVKNHNLKKDDEVQLLNRLMVESDVLSALKFLELRQTDLHGRDRLEQYFIDAVVLYLAWGPNPKMFPVPMNDWLIFDIFLGHEDPMYMVDMTERFTNSALMYKSEKAGANEADAVVIDYQLRVQDLVFEIIEKTKKKNPQIIERVVEQEIDNGHVVYDKDSDTLRIVDDSL